MSTREEIGLALNVINKLNGINNKFRAMADGTLNDITKINDLVGNPTKLVLLTSGLESLGVAVADLNSDKAAFTTYCNYILTNVPELTAI